MVALFWTGSLRKSILFNASVPQDSVLSPTLFPLYTNDLPVNVFCNPSRCNDNAVN